MWKRHFIKIQFNDWFLCIKHEPKRWKWRIWSNSLQI